MSIYRILKNRVPAKSLDDVDIPDSSWKPDFNVADRYQNFANELMRVTLLVMVGYGFLIKEIVGNTKYKSTELMFPCLCVGGFFLAVSLCLVLAHRFFSTDCLYYQVIIMRSLKRLESDNWTSTEKQAERGYIKESRQNQIKYSRKCFHILMCSTASFALGIIFVFTTFILAIHGIML
jgi:hypothetical protein